MRYLKYSFVFILGCLLIGCNTIRKFDKSDEYKKAPSCGKRIALPEDMKVDMIENHYPVPQAQHDCTNVSVVPPGCSFAK